MGFMTAPSGGGDFKVFVSYNAKAGRWYTKRDGKDEPQFEVADMTAVFDMPGLKTGWFKFSAGVAPEKVMDPSFTAAAANPGQDFKRGFMLDLFSDKNLLGVREFSSTAGIVIDAMNDLFDAWMAAPEVATGELPVVRCVGVFPVTNKHGTNYQPKFEIVGWTARPEALGDSDQPAPAAQTQAAATPPAPATPAVHMPPPAAAAPGAPLF
ncbi:MAG: hypothetical protein K2W86_00840 [Sphingomonas sp.]|uniref:hypothetical protein n=1 Tax=Sphingomonas sp. TaxID=28214 RepID=UPI0035A83B99|nr:hypothetical protein [Sphingomonas sp.]